MGNGMCSVWFGLSLVSSPLPAKTWHKLCSFFCSSIRWFFVFFILFFGLIICFFGFSYFVVDLDKSRRRRGRKQLWLLLSVVGGVSGLCIGWRGGGTVRQGAARLSQCRQTYTRTALDTHTHIYIYAKNSGFGLE